MVTIKDWPNWSVLYAVLPFFSEADTWSHFRTGQASDIATRAARDLIPVDIAFLSLNLTARPLPTGRSSAAGFQRLSKLFRFLDSLVLNSIFLSAASVPPARPPLRPTTIASVWKWLLPGAISDDATTDSLVQSPVQTSIHPFRSKLEILGFILSTAEDTHISSNRFASALVFIDPNISPQHLQTGEDIAREVRQWWASVQPQSTASTPLSDPGPRFRSMNWQNAQPGSISDRLFRNIARATCNDYKEHHVKLRLDGFRLDACRMEDPIHQVYLSSCTTEAKPYWYDTRCTLVSAPPADRQLPTVHDICYEIVKCRRRSTRHLSIQFDSESPDLWHLQPVTPIAASGHEYVGVSLETLLRNGVFEGASAKCESLYGHDPVDTDRKAVLALSLGLCLLHLLPSPWLRHPWSPKSIEFLCTSIGSGNVHIHTQAVYMTAQLLPSQQSRSFASIEPEEVHRFLTSFAQLLVEIELGKQMDAPTRSVEEIQRQLKKKMEPLGTQICREWYREAVHGCFHVKEDLERARVEHPQDINSERYLKLVREAVYSRVVHPLERNLEGVSIGLLDQLLDVCSQEIGTVGHHSGWYRFDMAAESKGSDSRIPTNEHQPNGAREAPHSTPINAHEPSMSPQVIVCDSVLSASTAIAIERSTQYFECFDRFREKHIIPITQSSTKRVKIAILDTGVDLEQPELRGLCDTIKDQRRDHKFLRRDWDPIVEIKDFTANADNKAPDKCGHGTLVAWMLLKTAPDVDLYIVKISNDVNCLDEKALEEAVLKAIDWSTDMAVDIMIMSFGFPDTVKSISKQIGKMVYDREPPMLVFAAASNDGVNSRRTFPASHAGVFAIHSLDGIGTDNGGLNPPIEKSHDDKFGTLGLGIPYTWNGRKEVRKGSSYAAPAAAGIAANCIIWTEWMKQQGHHDLSDRHCLALRSFEGIKLFLEKASKPSGPYLSIAPWNLWNGRRSPTMILGALLCELDT